VEEEKKDKVKTKIFTEESSDEEEAYMACFIDPLTGQKECA